jgi:hypothetical protein
MMSCRTSSAINSAITTEWGEARAARDNDRLMKIVNLGLAVTDSLGNAGPVTLRDERMANKLAFTLLAELPAGATLTPGGRKVSSMRTEIEDRGAYIKEASDHYVEWRDRLDQGGDEVIVGYADCMLSHGERVAMELALGESQPSPPSRSP